MTKQYRATVLSSDLRRMSKARQMEVMEEWFKSRYEDPAQSTPWHDGEYVFINGGPFDAREELEAEFSGIVKDVALDELVDELENESDIWTRTDEYDRQFYPPDDYEFEALRSEKRPLENLEKRLLCLRQLLKQKDLMDGSLQQFQLMMIFSFSIGSMEAFLSDLFTIKLLSDDEFKARYLKVDKDLAQKKISLSDLYDKHKSIDDIIKQQIIVTSFHSLERVSSLFKGVFSVDLGEIGDLVKMVHKRHDFVHRGGVDIDGSDTVTTKAEVTALISRIETLCRELNKKMSETFPPWLSP